MSEAANLVYQETTTTGTGDVTLVAKAGFRDFSAAFSVSAPLWYCIRHQTSGAFEVGIGHLSSASVLVRDTVIESSNANALVNFAGGTKDVICDVPASIQNTITAKVPYTGATATVDLGAQNLKMPSGTIIDAADVISIDPNTRELKDEAGTAVAGWGVGLTYGFHVYGGLNTDNIFSSTGTVDFGSGGDIKILTDMLVDNAVVDSIAPNSRILYDSGAASALNWNNSTGVTVDVALSVGTGAAPDATIHAQATTEQLRLGYDPSNYMSVTVGATGEVTFSATGADDAFVFSDPVTATSFTSTGVFAPLTLDAGGTNTAAIYGNFSPTGDQAYTLPDHSGELATMLTPIADTIAAIDSAFNVTSLNTSTYPDLTELSYVKGVTSDIQTQINALPIKTQTMGAGSNIAGALADQDYIVAIKMPFGGDITETTTKCATGTATATFKIGSTALGGTANSVSTSEQSQAHTTDNTFIAGDDIIITISSNAACEDMAFMIKYERTLD